MTWAARSRRVERMSTLTQIVDRVWDAIENNQLKKLADVVDADVHFKMPGIEANGLAALEQMLGAYLTAFPDLKHRVTHTIEAGDNIALQLVVTGTHTG